MRDVYRHRHQRVAEHQKVIDSYVKTQERVAAAEVFVAEDDQHQYAHKNRAAGERAAVPVEHQQVAGETTETELQNQKQQQLMIGE